METGPFEATNMKTTQKKTIQAKTNNHTRNQTKKFFSRKINKCTSECVYLLKINAFESLAVLSLTLVSYKRGKFLVQGWLSCDLIVVFLFEIKPGG